MWSDPTEMETIDVDVVNDDPIAEDINFRLDTLLQLFPQGDFKYLRSKCLELSRDYSAFEAFVNDALATGSVPSAQEETNSSSEAMSINRSAIVFDVENFLEECPDPFTFFENLERTEENKKQTYELLKDRFRDVKSSFIEHIFVEQNYNLVRCAAFLMEPPPHAIRMMPRPDMEMNLSYPLDDNHRKEVLLLDHREEIQAYLQLQEEIKKTAIEEGQVFVCECCYSDDILPRDAIMCSEAHIFCKDCIRRSTEVRIGDGQVTFPCLQSCTPEGKIPLSSIQKVLNPKAYQKLMARVQEEEVKMADIDGIEYCQRCEYAACVDETVVIFKCQKCQFELCRLCNRESHIPRKCGESVQDDAQKQQRKQHEELETTRVLRRCGGCRKAFVKDAGCDFIACPCGTTNCYKCGASSVSHDHTDRCTGTLPQVL